MKKPNIVLIVLDTLRADKIFSRYKNQDLTPTLNQISKNSIYFKNCFSNTTWTLPSHNSMFTGLYPTQNMLISGEVDRISDRVPLLPEILKEIGYYNFCYTENAFISEQFGLTRGFDKIIKNWKSGDSIWNNEKYEFSIISWIIKNLNNLFKLYLRKQLFLKIWHHIKFRIEKFIRKLIKRIFWKHLLFEYENETQNYIEESGNFLKSVKSQKKPLFLFFNIMVNHYPYIPLFNLFNLFDIKLKDFKKIRSFMQTPYLKIRNGINIQSYRIEKDKVEILNKLYNATVFYSDIIIKNVIKMLKNLEIHENSYLLITSDHGEHLFNKNDHYLWEHSTFQSVYRNVIKVPLMIYSKKFKNNNKIIEEQVQLKDLFHTILHMTKTEFLKNKQLKLERSILHQIEDRSTPEYIFGEYLKDKNFKSLRKLAFKSYLNNSINKKVLMKILKNIFFLRTNSYKLIKYEKSEEFYDLTKDPFEQNNIADKNDKNYLKFKKKLEKILDEISDIDNLKKMVTNGEKTSLKRAIKNLSINGI